MLNIPILSVNFGVADTKELNITHHISQLKYQEKIESGSRMAKESIISAIVLSHNTGNTAIRELYRGFEDGIKYVSSNIKYNGLCSIPVNNKLVYIETVQNTIRIESDRDGISNASIGVQTLNALMMGHLTTYA